MSVFAYIRTCYKYLFYDKKDRQSNIHKKQDKGKTIYTSSNMKCGSTCGIRSIVDLYQVVDFLLVFRSPSLITQTDMKLLKYSQKVALNINTSWAIYNVNISVCVALVKH